MREAKADKVPPHPTPVCVARVLAEVYLNTVALVLGQRNERLSWQQILPWNRGILN